MHIIYVTVATLRSTTAHAAYVLNLCSELSKFAQRVRLIGCMAQKTDPVTNLENWAGPNQGRFEIVEAPVWSRSRESRIWSLALRLLVTSQWFSKDDLVITHNEVIAFVMRLKGIPFIYDTHGLSPRSRILRFAARGENLRGCIFNSVRMKEEFLRRILDWKGAALVLGSGVRAELLNCLPPKKQARAELGLPRTSTIIGYVGSLGRDRGIDLMLEAASLLDNISKDLFWLFVGGKKSEIEGWIYYARKLKILPERYLFAGHQPQKDLASWYAATDILCAPYTSKVKTVEVMAPMKLVEYKAANRPIIASDFPAVRAALVDAVDCHYFKKDSSDSLGRVLLSRLSTKPERARRQVTHRCTKTQESWTNKAEQLGQWLSRLELTTCVAVEE